MLKGRFVSIELCRGNEKGYIIKDRSGITAGRIEIIEYVSENKYCSFRIKLYKNEDRETYLNDILKVFLDGLFLNSGIKKINAYVQEGMELQPFIHFGFQLEGVISESMLKNDLSADEYIFGITVSNYGKLLTTNVIRLKGKKIELKILTPDDAEDLLGFYMKNREYLKPYEPARSENFYTVETQRNSIVEDYKQYLNGTGIAFGIYKDDRFIGKIRVSNIVLGVFKNAFIGYSIDEDEQGNGYMKEAVSLVVDFVFKEIELHRIEASTLTDNVKSQRVLEACGFKKIGISERYLFIDGKWRDHYTFYKLNE